MQVAGQLQALLAEKARLASENARLAHENTSLQVQTCHLPLKAIHAQQENSYLQLKTLAAVERGL